MSDLFQPLFTTGRNLLDFGDLKPGVSLNGVDARGPVEVLASSQVGETRAYNVAYRRPDGSTGIIVLDENATDVQVVSAKNRWTFDSDGAVFRLVTEAQRIRYAYLFDPLLAVHTSLVDPLPHQITAVYHELLTRSPLRYLLADDPGAGKTIMTGLFIRELIARGDLQRCLIVVPGALDEQWQDELKDKFHLKFSILTSDQLEASGGARWFEDHPLAIARLDKLSRDDTLQKQLRHVTTWDLVVIDEAHKMSATLFGSEVKRTKRYHLGQLLSTLTRHFLLLSATPHNGKEPDFQLFLSLLDPDRFEGKYREEHGSVGDVDISDIMRRLVKENLLRFDGHRLFPERRASTIGFELSPTERELYDAVTAYVRDQFNRADRLGSDRRKGNIGFALTILQRRLASSTAAISASLTRRRERLEKRLQDTSAALFPVPEVDIDLLDEIDDLPATEAEALTERVVDESTAATTIEELRLEISVLRDLEALALRVTQDANSDRKWRELASILSIGELMTDGNWLRRKFVIFTEHRDTLTYLVDRLRNLRGRHDAVVAIHGGLRREQRKEAERAFKNDPAVEILVATDAAGEGINLQRAHLMANYDLPWNPNRIEQRFGRIHRINQTEVCHLWNFLALDTREGDVFTRLFQKMEVQRAVLGDGIFDILGMLFRNQPLRDLLVEAIRYGDSPSARARSEERLDNLLDVERARELMRERALAADTMDLRAVNEVRAEMERAEVRRLQPHFIRSFFVEAFIRLGGTFRKAEQSRLELTHVPLEIRTHARMLFGVGLPRRYERVAFEKEHLPGPPPADFLCPGHPLLDTVVDLVLSKLGDTVRSGAILVDPTDESDEPRILLVFESTVQDGRVARNGKNEIASRELHFIERSAKGETRGAGFAPHLDYRPTTVSEHDRALAARDGTWLSRDPEAAALAYALETLLPRQVEELSQRTRERVARVRSAVRERLTREVLYHEGRAGQLEAEERLGKQLKVNSRREREWADELRMRLQNRLDDLDNQDRLNPMPPRLLGCSLVVPIGWFRLARNTVDLAARREVELVAMSAVMEAERKLGFAPRDVSADNLGYDIESSITGSGKLRFIEVKGRNATAPVITVTKNEILTALNKPDDFILALVPAAPGQKPRPQYLRRPFFKEPDFGATSVNYAFDDLLARASDPS